MLLASGKLQEKDIKPEVGLYEHWIADFFELSSARSFGMSVGPVPFTAIWQYAERFECDDFFVETMRVLDNEFLRAVNTNGNDGKKGSKSNA